LCTPNFENKAAEDFVLLGHDAGSLDSRFSTYRESVVALYSEVKDISSLQGDVASIPEDRCPHLQLCENQFQIFHWISPWNSENWPW